MIHLKPVAGLCNRMRAIDSAIALAHSHSMPVKIYWVSTPNMNCPFYKLFEKIPDSNIILKEYRYTPLKFIPLLFRSNPLVKLLRINKHSFTVFDNKILKQLDISKIDRSTSLIIESYSRFFDNPNKYNYLRPIPELREKISERTRNFEAHTIGVHVRRTDHVKSIQYSPDELFINRMHQEVNRNPKTTFYLATDSMDVKRKFIAEFGERIMTTSAEASRTSIEGVQEALVELYALSKTKRIFGSYWSSYSHTASELGGIELTSMSTGED